MYVIYTLYIGIWYINVIVRANRTKMCFSVFNTENFVWSLKNAERIKWHINTKVPTYRLKYILCSSFTRINEKERFLI